MEVHVHYVWMMRGFGENLSLSEFAPNLLRFRNVVKVDVDAARGRRAPADALSYERWRRRYGEGIVKNNLTAVSAFRRGHATAFRISTLGIRATA